MANGSLPSTWSSDRDKGITVVRRDDWDQFEVRIDVDGSIAYDEAPSLIAWLQAHMAAIDAKAAEEARDYDRARIDHLITEVTAMRAEVAALKAKEATS